MPPSKPTLRTCFLKSRIALQPEMRAELSRACCERLVSCIRELRHTQPVVAFYHPIKDELDVLPAFRALQNESVTALPVVGETRLLSFRRFVQGDPLMEGRFGVPEPLEKASAVVPDIVITPLLAFDRNGHRLGYGAGYYDTTLSSLRYEKTVLAIGAAFAMQEAQKLPADARDEPLDCIVTDRETFIPRTL